MLSAPAKPGHHLKNSRDQSGLQRRTRRVGDLLESHVPTSRGGAASLLSAASLSFSHAEGRWIGAAEAVRSENIFEAYQLSCVNPRMASSSSKLLMPPLVHWRRRLHCPRLLPNPRVRSRAMRSPKLARAFGACEIASQKAVARARCRCCAPLSSTSTLDIRWESLDQSEHLTG